ncbi:tetratricopeptide repeat protein [Psychrobacillus sp. FJAT-51614]|uniref:Tetratricopeptide repeat protein n=1 Tax=Psychrobacillus mangrovi TaxID=3117745 RepID=A0ABU8EZQ1_9BACI
MNEELEQALKLREDGKKKESNQLFIKLAEEFPTEAILQYQCAWSFDVLGEEAKAAPYYESAIELGIPTRELEGALLGLGSTYRTLGEYEKSKRVFLNAIKLFPKNKAIQVFYSMTLYNLQEHSEAMELLLTNLIDTTSDEEILSYKKAIRFYSNKLGDTWK